MIPAIDCGVTKENETMTTTTYKGYTILVIGLSHHIHRPGYGDHPQAYAPGYAQSMAAAKRWINEDIKEQRSEAISKNVVTWNGLR